jgi:glucosyl-3-phosphoglycerate synthase
MRQADLVRLVTGDALPRVDHRDFDVGALAAAKVEAGVSTSVCLPARDEGTTIAAIVGQLVGHRLVDEVLVVDDHSTDDTAEAARAEGATVVQAAEILPEHGDGPGKGQALWKAVAASRGDLVAFCDADVRDFDQRFVVGLLGPLLADPEVAFVKAYYQRPGDGQPRGGGRVTELVARPLLHLLFPELAGVVQPLAGEFAGRRELLESLPFVEGYGVDLGLLVDVTRAVGAHRVVQADLGRRIHRNRPLTELGPMATEVLQTALRRAGVEVPAEIVLERPDDDAVVLRWGERPPLRSITRSRR